MAGKAMPKGKVAAKGRSTARGSQPATAKVVAMKVGRPKKVAVAPMKEKRVRRVIGLEEARAQTKMTQKQWLKHQVGMPEAWPAPDYMAEPGRGGHMCFREQTYSIITRWMAETKISYRPHAKRPGSKSHVRYEKYSRAKTVGDALKLGSWPADWCWDYERGFIKVSGPVRDEPMDISKMDDEQLTPVDKAINRWYVKELARCLGLKVSEIKDGMGSGEGLFMRANRLVSQRKAKAAMEAAGKQRRQIHDDEVLDVLRAWAFGRNQNRVNVMPEGQDYVWSDTLGLVRDRMGDIHLTPPTKRYPEVATIINKWLADRLPAETRGFTWTSLNLNCNYAARLHRDGNNFGPSYIKAFGDFTGGRLNYWPEDDRKQDRLEALQDKDKVQLDLKNGLALFSGNCAHSVEDFQGERYSVVFFTIGAYDRAAQEVKDGCRGLGMAYPPAGEDPHRFIRAPRGYKGSGKAAAPLTKRGTAAMPTWRYYPSSEKSTPSRPSMKRPSPKAQGGRAAKKRAVA